jgi:hypothetical protein
MSGIGSSKRLEVLVLPRERGRMKRRLRCPAYVMLK